MTKGKRGNRSNGTRVHNRSTSGIEQQTLTDARVDIDTSNGRYVSIVGKKTDYFRAVTDNGYVYQYIGDDAKESFEGVNLHPSLTVKDNTLIYRDDASELKSFKGVDGFIKEHVDDDYESFAVLRKDGTPLIYVKGIEGMVVTPFCTSSIINQYSARTGDEDLTMIHNHPTKYEGIETGKSAGFSEADIATMFDDYRTVTNLIVAAKDRTYTFKVSPELSQLRRGEFGSMLRKNIRKSDITIFAKTAPLVEAALRREFTEDYGVKFHYDKSDGSTVFKPEHRDWYYDNSENVNKVANEVLNLYLHKHYNEINDPGIHEIVNRFPNQLSYTNEPTKNFKRSKKISAAKSTPKKENKQKVAPPKKEKPAPKTKKAAPKKEKTKPKKTAPKPKVKKGEGVPEAYKKLMRKYARRPNKMTEADKDQLNKYIKEYGYISV